MRNPNELSGQPNTLAVDSRRLTTPPVHNTLEKLGTQAGRGHRLSPSEQWTGKGSPMRARGDAWSRWFISLTGPTKAKLRKGLPAGKDWWLGNGDNHSAPECQEWLSFNPPQTHLDDPPENSLGAPTRPPLGLLSPMPPCFLSSYSPCPCLSVWNKNIYCPHF